MSELPQGWVETVLGLLPENWTPIEAQFYCDKVADGTHNSPKKTNDGKLLITSKNIKDSRLDTESAYHISCSDFVEVNKRSKVDRWDVLLSMIGTVGEVCLIYKEPDFAIKNVGLFKCGNKTKARWLYYFLKSKTGRHYILSRLSGTTQKYITLGELRKFPVPNPPLPEQKAIAAVLSAFDDKIELLREQNETLETLAQTIFKEWFVHFNFPDQNGKPYRDNGGEMVDSELGKIPKGWRVGKLGEEFDITMGQSPKGKTYNEIGDGMVFYQGRAEFQKRFPKRRLYTTDPKRIAEPFDVLMSVRAPVGDINVASEKCCIGRGLSAVSSQYKSYALYKMKSIAREFKHFESAGTVFGSINKSAFENISVLIPNQETIELYDSIVSVMDKKIFNNVSQIQTLSKTRDTLLPKLMSGQLRVSV